MNDRLLSALSARRARLNAAILAHRTLAWAAPSAIAAGVIVAALRAFGLRTPAFALWAVLVAAGAAVGALRAWKARVDEADAARWLDDRLGGALGKKELLSAALACVGRGSAGLFDAHIISEAEELLPRAASLRVSPRPFVKRAGFSCLACAIGAYLVFLAAPFSFPSQGSRAAARSGKPDSGSARAGSGEDAANEGKTAASFAATLFPDDKRLAKLAERALLEGRLDDLRDMLKTADADYGSRIDRALSEAEKKKLTREREMLQEASRALALGSLGMGQDPRSAKDRAAADGDTGDGVAGADLAPDQGSRPERGGAAPSRGQRGYGPGEGPVDSGSSRSAGSGGGQSSEGGGQGEGGAQGRGGVAAGGEGTGGKDAGRGGTTAGTGTGSERDWGTIGASTGKEEVLQPSKKANFFELILPGQPSSSPISSLVPASRRSAESAMAREGVPLEYEDFVRSYFIALSKGETR